MHSHQGRDRFSPDDILVSSRVEPDAVVVLEGDAPAPENHRIICRIAGHFSQGTVGILVVAP